MARCQAPCIHLRAARSIPDARSRSSTVEWCGRNSWEMCTRPPVIAPTSYRPPIWACAHGSGRRVWSGSSMRSDGPDRQSDGGVDTLVTIALVGGKKTGRNPMKGFRLAATAVLFIASAGIACAQTTLRIGLAEDPDILDPTLARTYVGRIVFASFCDKLFDIDEKLNVVSQLALSHETSEDGKAVTIRLRPGVKFHDGESLDAAAAKFSLERHLTMPGSTRRAEISAIDHIEVADPLTIRLELKTPFAPLIAQLTDRAGMMVSPKAARAAGDKFGLSPVCAG